MAISFMSVVTSYAITSSPVAPIRNSYSQKLSNDSPNHIHDGRFTSYVNNLVVQLTRGRSRPLAFLFRPAKTACSFSKAEKEQMTILSKNLAAFCLKTPSALATRNDNSGFRALREIVWLGAENFAFSSAAEKALVLKQLQLMPLKYFTILKNSSIKIQSKTRIVTDVQRHLLASSLMMVILPFILNR